MKEQFTPGDWEAFDGTVFCDDSLISDCTISENTCFEDEANAHLIAAAPKMYRKLKEIADKNFFTTEINQLLAEARGETI